MKKLMAIGLVCTLSLVAVTAEDSYSTEGIVIPVKDKRQCQIVVRVSKVSEENGKTTKTLVATPRFLTNLGQKASFFMGNDDPKTQCVSVDVLSPKSTSDSGTCVTAVTQGKQVLSKETTTLKWSSR